MLSFWHIKYIPANMTPFTTLEKSNSTMGYQWCPNRLFVVFFFIGNHQNSIFVEKIFGSVRKRDTFVRKKIGIFWVFEILWVILHFNFNSVALFMR